MNSAIWYNISIVFLIVGIVFLLVTIALSIKFQLFSIIRAELQNKKSSGEEYFAYVESKNKQNNVVEQFPHEEGFRPDAAAFRKQADVPSGTLPSRGNRGRAAQKEQTAYAAADTPTVISTAGRRGGQEEEINATVLVSSRNKNAQSSDTVVRSRSAAPPEEEERFVITENIMVIHGDPGSI